MKQIRFQMHRLSVLQIAVILLIIGLFFGILSANIFRSAYINKMADYENVVFTDISKSDIDYSGLFFYVLGKNLREFTIYWLLCITVLGIPYMAFKVVSFGFTAGFFISAVTMQFGFKGMLLIFVYVFPQGLIYLPVSLLCLYKGFQLCRTINNDKRNYLGAITKQIKPYLLLILILAVLLLAGSFLEAYVVSFLLKKTLGIFT